MTRISELDPRQTPAIVLHEGTDQEDVVYGAWPHQVRFHGSTAPNVLALGTRGTGKSLMLRREAQMRCLMIPNFRALILRRTMPELRLSHLNDIGYEMTQLGGEYLSTTSTAKFPNGSTLVFRHCETEADILNFLSSQYGFIGFDELSTFSLDQFIKISAAARAPVGAGYQAVVRAGSNPLGPGADWMYTWFVDKTTDMADFPDYNPNDFEMQFSTLDDNPSLDGNEYKKRLRNLPDHVRRAWLLGERVIEGMYFSDFHRMDEAGNPWHVVDSIPVFNDEPVTRLPWINIYRAIDWGYFPDPAICLWIAVLPDKRCIAFKERKWSRTNAPDVAKQIVRESEGMHIVESFCDPKMLIKEGNTFSIGDLFEMNGVPVTASQNDRVLSGYAIHEYLNTLINEKPRLQILKGAGMSYGCADLIRTIPQMRMDKLDPAKIADGEDHWVMALSYFCMGSAPPSRNPVVQSVPRYLRRTFR